MGITSRIDAVTDIGEDFLNKVCPPPPSIKTETSNACNYRCSFCALRTREKQTNDKMPWDHLKHVMDIARNAGVEEWGCFYLGEATMAPELLLSEIRYAKGICFPYVFLTTNGSLLSDGFIERLMEAGLDSLKFSINAKDDTQFEEIMGVKSKNFHKSLNSLKQARNIRDEGGYETKIYASYIQFDGNQADEMEMLLNIHVRPYADEIYALPLYSMGLWAAQIEQDTGYKPTHGNMGRIDDKTGLPKRKGVPCWSVFKEAHVRINPDNGHPILAACCFGADSRFDICDLSEYDNFMDAWNHPKLQEIRAAHLTCIEQDSTDPLKGTMCEVCTAFNG
jgi:MoaA/NifB/PqqE/SkfB family radical SAM enzyme